MFGCLARTARQFALPLALLVPAAATALETKWSDSEESRVRLVVAGTEQAAGFVRGGIEIRLEPGWHTYWRYPGDAGLPPRFDWSASENLDRAEVLWPAPVRIAVEEGIQSIGYKDLVLLPVHIRPRDPAKPVVLRLRMDYGVCEKICIPVTADLHLTVPPNAGQSYPALDRAEAQVPVARKLGGQEAPGILAVKLERGPKPTAVVDVAVAEGKPFDLFAEGPTAEWALPLPKPLEAKDGRARFVIPIDGAPAGGGPIPASLRLTLVSGERAVETVATFD